MLATLNFVPDSAYAKNRKNIASKRDRGARRWRRDVPKNVYSSLNVYAYVCVCVWG